MNIWICVQNYFCVWKVFLTWEWAIPVCYTDQADRDGILPLSEPCTGLQMCYQGLQEQNSPVQLGQVQGTSILIPKYTHARE